MKRKIVFLGMGGVYSLIPFEKIVAAGFDVVGLVTARPDDKEGGPAWIESDAYPVSELPIYGQTGERNVVSAAHGAGIPVLSVGDMEHEDTLEALVEFDAGLYITACFPRILPNTWLGIPEEGCVNIHPSMLPSYRGPYPLFWQFYNGEKNTGVTLHFMEEGIDSGEIARQKAVKFPEGCSAQQADEITAEAGADMLLEVLPNLAIPSSPQPEEGASYFGVPTINDREITSDWGIMRSYNFIRGAGEWAPFWIKSKSGKVIEVMQVHSFQVGGSPPGEGWVEMKDGFLQVE